MTCFKMFKINFKYIENNNILNEKIFVFGINKKDILRQLYKEYNILEVEFEDNYENT